MQTLKIVIKGKFWDTQIYNDRLYLFDLEGAVRLVDWPSLVSSFTVPDRCQLAMECSFLRSDYLYGNKWNRLFQDTEVQQLMKSKFHQLLNHPLEIDHKQLDSFTKAQEDTPFPFAHNESLFYKDHLYAVSQSGVYSKYMSGENLTKEQAGKSWDAPVSGLDIKLDVLALAAGEHGLYRMPSTTYTESLSLSGLQAERVANQLCNDCNYVRSSILTSAYDLGSTLTEYQTPKRSADRTENDRSQEFWQAKPLDVIEGEHLFHEETRGSFCWGSHDRICMAKDGVLTVIKYLPFSQRRRHLSSPVQKITLSSWKGSPVSGDNAVFGAILELDSALVVVRSDSNVDTFPGEPVNWRTFARSKHYTNQLHIVYDDRLEILSFNHDYFVKQPEKQFGEPYVEHAREYWTT